MRYRTVELGLIGITVETHEHPVSVRRAIMRAAHEHGIPSVHFSCLSQARVPGERMYFTSMNTFSSLRVRNVVLRRAQQILRQLRERSNHG